MIHFLVPVSRSLTLVTGYRLPGFRFPVSARQQIRSNSHTQRPVVYIGRIQ
jgi:hypothetical protein